jgi:hypothetical protein
MPRHVELRDNAGVAEHFSKVPFGRKRALLLLRAVWTFQLHKAGIRG